MIATLLGQLDGPVGVMLTNLGGAEGVVEGALQMCPRDERRVTSLGDVNQSLDSLGEASVVSDVTPSNGLDDPQPEFRQSFSNAPLECRVQVLDLHAEMPDGVLALLAESANVQGLDEFDVVAEMAVPQPCDDVRVVMVQSGSPVLGEALEEEVPTLTVDQVQLHEALFDQRTQQSVDVIRRWVGGEADRLDRVERPSTSEDPEAGEQPGFIWGQ